MPTDRKRVAVLPIERVRGVRALAQDADISVRSACIGFRLAHRLPEGRRFSSSVVCGCPAHATRRHPRHRESGSFHNSTCGHICRTVWRGAREVQVSRGARAGPVVVAANSGMWPAHRDGGSGSMEVQVFDEWHGHHRDQHRLPGRSGRLGRLWAEVRPLGRFFIFRSQVVLQPQTITVVSCRRWRSIRA